MFNRIHDLIVILFLIIGNSYMILSKITKVLISIARALKSYRENAILLKIFINFFNRRDINGTFYCE
jgi:hypothetical protein